MIKGRNPTFIRSGIFICSISLILINCTFHNEEILFADEVCNTTGEITYSSFVRPIIENRCVSCHNADIPSGSVNLESYSGLTVQVENGRFVGAIKHRPGFAPMPQGETQLSDCNIEMIEIWISNGFPEN